MKLPSTLKGPSGTIVRIACLLCHLSLGYAYPAHITFSNRVERQLKTSIRSSPADLSSEDFINGLLEDVKGMTDEASNTTADELGFDFSVLLWPFTLAGADRAKPGVPYQMFFQGWGRRFIRNGMLPVWGCQHPASPQWIPRTLGWPCRHGGSVGVSEPNRASSLWHCMLFYLPASQAEYEPLIRLDGSTFFNPHERYEAARDHCKLHMGRPVDLTEMARCIYLNYPRVFPEYPPPPRGKGRRLKGVAVMLGGEDERLPAGGALRSRLGGLILDFFDMPPADLNALPVTLTCVCAISPRI